MTTDNIAYHPAFGKPPVVNTVRVYNSSRKRKVIRLTKERRFALKVRREQRENKSTQDREYGAFIERVACVSRIHEALKVLDCAACQAVALVAERLAGKGNPPAA